MLAVGLAVAAGTLTACGSGAATRTTGQPATTTGGAATVAVLTGGALGDHLTDGAGRTLYEYDADSGGTSSCSGDCARTWPAFATSGPPVAGTGAQSGLLGITTRDDGTIQVVYNGHPLYYYHDDGTGRDDGQGHGQGVDGAWWVVSPAGQPVHTAPGDDSGGGGGY
jgi:predicted lipoprotein with Yx(FWY)xxD motif